jgi:hypothetical protein
MRYVLPLLRVPAAAVVLSTLAACATVEPLPPRVVAGEAVQKIPVYLDPDVKIVLAGDSVTEAVGRKFVAALRPAITRELGQAGFTVAADKNDKHAVSLVMHLQLQSGHEAVVTLRALRDDVEIAKVGYATSTHDLYEIGPYGSVTLVSALAQQPSLAAFARDPAGYIAARKAPAVAIAQVAPAPAPVVVAAPPPPPPPPPLASSAFVVAAPQPTAWALIVGIEKYRDLPAPPGALADAQRFKKLVSETFGVPPDQIIEAVDTHAGKSDIEKHLGALGKRVRAGDRVYFFFSGHGAPDASNGTSYLVPYDGDPSALEESALPLATVLDKLGKTKAKEVIAFVDSCFSGSGGRSVLPAGARPLVKLKEVQPSAASVMLFSAASGAEISGPNETGKGGVFSDYLVEGLGTGRADMDGDGQISLKELADWVKPRVSREAQKAGRTQTPNVATSAEQDKVIVGWGYRKQ